MAQFRVVLIDKEGRQHVRSLAANDSEAAARTAVGITGWQCISCDPETERTTPTPHKNQTADGTIPRPVAGGSRVASRIYLERTQRHPIFEFFDFRIMISPYLLRGLFVLATFVLVVGVAISPRAYIAEYAAVNEARERKINGLHANKKEAEDILARVPPLEKAIAEANAEREQHVNEPNRKIALREADVKLENAKRVLLATLAPARVRTVEELKGSISSFDKELAAVPPLQFPSVLPLATQIGAMVLAWITLRLALELYCVLFAIHERLTEIRDRRVGASAMK